MPLRPRQHELEDASRRRFEAALSDRLVYRTLDHDYGIDGEVEEFVEGHATGLKFFVQLKATDKEDVAEALKVSVRLSTATYLRAQSAPVLMVRYLAHGERLYVRWFHQFDPNYEHVGEGQLTFHWAEADLLEPERVERLPGEARAVLKAKSAWLELPMRAEVTIPSAGAFGLTRAELELGVRAAATHGPDLLRIEATQHEQLLALRIDEGEVGAGVAGLGSIALHLDEAGGDGAGIGHEVLSCAALALARAGHLDLAARMGVHYFPESALAHIPPAGGELAEAMAASGRATEALEVAERLERRGEGALSALAFVFTLAALRRSTLLSIEERRRLVAALEGQIAHRAEAGESLAAAGLAVGLGNHRLSAGEPDAAVDAFRRALELDSEYESREHFWLELGGAHFHAGDYLDAAAAYERALSLSEEPASRTEALRADALMRAGRYEESRKIFESVHADLEEKWAAAWVTTKVLALRHVGRTTGIDGQTRDPDAAAQQADLFNKRAVGEGELEDVARSIWELDAVSPLGWFNLARSYLDAGRTADGMYAYLVAATMQEGDVEAWCNVATLGLSLGEIDLFAAAVITGARANGERLMNELVKHAQRNLEDLEAREKFLQAVNALLEDALPPPSEKGFELRFVEPGKPLESLHLPIPGSRS